MGGDRRGIIELFSQGLPQKREEIFGFDQAADS